MATPEERLEQAANMAENASSIASDWANGPDRNVTPEPISGPLPTIRKFLASKSVEIDNAANAAAVLRSDLQSDQGASNVNFGTVLGNPNVDGLGLASIVNRAENTNTYATGRLMSKIASGFGGTILVVSDSTGNEPSEWVYRLAQKLAANNSALTVNYRLWDVANDVYLPPVVFGSGAIVVDIYNAAVSGSRPDYFYGSRFATMIANISVLDLLIINHGHNLITQSNDTDTLRRRAPQLLELPAMLTRLYPGFGLIFVAQNPQRDNNNYEPVYRAIVDAAGICSADLANVYSEFIRLGKPADLYNDNIHPNFDGQTIFLDKIYYFFSPSSHKAMRDFIDNGADNLLYNGDFLEYGSSGPIGLTTSGATPSKEFTIKETGEYSLKLTSVSQGSLTTARFEVPNYTNLAGSVVTLAVRMFIPSTNTDLNSGRIGLLTNTDTTNNTSGNSGKGGWHWRFISILVPAGAAYLRAVVYCSSASTAGSIIYIDRMILCRGRLPCDNFPATQLPNYRYLNYTGSASSIDVLGVETLEIAAGYSGTLSELTSGVVGQFLRLIARGNGVFVSGNTSGNIRHQHADRTVPLRAGTVYFARFDGSLWLILNPMPRTGCEFVGDESVTLYVGVNAQNQVYDTELTANRSVTTGISGAQAGDIFNITRTANATGGTLTNGATGKVITVGTWAEFLFTGSVWILNRQGTL